MQAINDPHGLSFQQRLEKATGGKVKDIDSKKIVDGYEESKSKFDNSHAMFTLRVSERSSSWYPDSKTLKGMSRNVEDMRIFYKCYLRKMRSEKTEYCGHDKVWWLSQIAVISNLIVDLLALITLVIETFYPEIIDERNISFSEEHYSQSQNATTAQPLYTILYWGIVAVCVSFIFSKLRIYAETKVTNTQEELTYLTKVFRDGKIENEEYKNKLRLWEKTANLYLVNKKITRKDSRILKQRCERLNTEIEPELLSFVHQAIQAFSSSEEKVPDVLLNNEGGGGEKSPSSEVSSIDVKKDRGRECFEKCDFNLEKLIEFQYTITLARAAFTTAIDEVNDQVGDLAHSDYTQSLELIEENTSALRKLFDEMDQIPKWYFESLKVHNIIRAISLTAIEIISIVTVSIKDYVEPSSESIKTIDVVVLVLFLIGVFLSALNPFIHKGEVTQLKLSREVTYLKGLRWILKDLDSVRAILETHHRWSEQNDEVTKQRVYLEYMEKLKQTKSSLLGLKVQKMLKKLQKKPRPVKNIASSNVFEATFDDYPDVLSSTKSCADMKGEALEKACRYTIQECVQFDSELETSCDEDSGSDSELNMQSREGK